MLFGIPSTAIAVKLPNRLPLRSRASCSLFAIPSVPGHRSRNYRPLQRISNQIRPLSIGESASRSPQELAGRQLIRKTELQASCKDRRLPNLQNQFCDAKECRCPHHPRIGCYGPPCNGARRYGSWAPGGRLMQFTGTPTSPPLHRTALRTQMGDSRALTHAEYAEPTSCMDSPPPDTRHPASGFTLMQAETHVVTKTKRSPETNRPISPRTDLCTLSLVIVHLARAAYLEPPPCATSVSIRPPSVEPHTRHTMHQDKTRECPEYSWRFWISPPADVPRPKHRDSPGDLGTDLPTTQGGLTYTHSWSVDWGQTWN